MDADSDAARLWLDQFVRDTDTSDSIERLVGQVNDRIIDALPQLAADPTLRAELYASTRAHWRGFLAVVARQTFEVNLPPEAFDLARTIARRGFDIAVLLAIYRIGQL